MQAKLILQVKNGLSKVIDESEFYKKNGYEIKGNTNNQAVKYETSPLDKQVPDGFPSVK